MKYKLLVLNTASQAESTITNYTNDGWVLESFNTTVENCRYSFIALFRRD